MDGMLNHTSLCITNSYFGSFINITRVITRVSEPTVADNNYNPNFEKRITGKKCLA